MDMQQVSQLINKFVDANLTSFRYDEGNMHIFLTRDANYNVGVRLKEGNIDEYFVYKISDVDIYYEEEPGYSDYYDEYDDEDDEDYGDNHVDYDYEAYEGDDNFTYLDNLDEETEDYVEEYEYSE